MTRPCGSSSAVSKVVAASASAFTTTCTMSPWSMAKEKKSCSPPQRLRLFTVITGPGPMAAAVAWLWLLGSYASGWQPASWQRPEAESHM